MATVFNSRAKSASLDIRCFEIVGDVEMLRGTDELRRNQLEEDFAQAMRLKEVYARRNEIALTNRDEAIGVIAQYTRAIYDFFGDVNDFMLTPVPSQADREGRLLNMLRWRSVLEIDDTGTLARDWHSAEPKWLKALEA